MKLYNYNI